MKIYAAGKNTDVARKSSPASESKPERPLVSKMLRVRREKLSRLGVLVFELYGSRVRSL